MRRGRPGWFWAVTASLILAWALAGTVSISFILSGNVYFGEAVIIVSTVSVILLYYLIDRYVVIE